MKKLIVLLFIILNSPFLIPKTYAATQVATPSSTTQEKNQEDLQQKFIDRVASRVAQLKLVDRRGIIGNVTDVSNTQITLTDIQNVTRFVDVDELTKFSSPSAKESFGISDITKGSILGVLGLYNKQSQRLLARFVDVLVLPKIIQGAIAATDTENFTIDFVNQDQQHFLIDVQNSTRTLTYTKDTGLIRSGFSKIKAGQRILIVGFSDSKEKNKIIPTRIIIFPEVPKNPKIVILPADTTPTTKPATQSAKPITR